MINKNRRIFEVVTLIYFVLVFRHRFKGLPNELFYNIPKTQIQYNTLLIDDFDFFEIGIVFLRVKPGRISFFNSLDFPSAADIDVDIKFLVIIRRQDVLT